MRYLKTFCNFLKISGENNTGNIIFTNLKEFFKVAVCNLMNAKLFFEIMAA
jgi:hypothetical protein